MHYHIHKYDTCTTTFTGADKHWLKCFFHIGIDDYECNICKKTGTTDITDKTNVSFSDYEKQIIVTYDSKNYIMDSIDNYTDATCIKYDNTSKKSVMTIGADKPIIAYTTSCFA